MNNVFIHNFKGYNTLSFTDTEEGFYSFTPDTLTYLGEGLMLCQIRRELTKCGRPELYTECVILILDHLKRVGGDNYD